MAVFNLDEWKALWDAAAEDLEVAAGQKADRWYLVKAAAQTRRLMLLADLVEALGRSSRKKLAQDDPPLLWDLQAAARHALGRAWVYEPDSRVLALESTSVRESTSDSAKPEHTSRTARTE